MASLYELSSAYASLIDAYDTSDSDDEREEVLAMLAAAEGDISDKAEAYAKIIRMKEAEAKAFKEEADRLTAHKRADENMVKRLTAAMLDAMKLTGAQEIRTSIGKWRVQMNPWSCEVVDIDEIPQEYHIHQPDTADKNAMLNYFKNTGEIIPGAEFKQEQGIRFR